ncbi:hypothetical protein CRUP_010588 [Coryphaenoides rupestris]|nr:hypothetical protein CRUP_010588 [Coryphaenoides rupestris]
MSHNTKRLPRRLRRWPNRMREKSLKAGAKKKEQPKSKSRKARRRHGNMLLEFNRRQRRNVWLETHIWHAKRFHVLRRWGYCLGDRPTAKQGSTTVVPGGPLPLQPLGPVSFLWRPRTPGSSHRQLWIWAHPTLKQDLLPELQTACRCSEPVIPATTAAPVATPVEPPPPPRQAQQQKEKTPGTKRKRSAGGDGDGGPPAEEAPGDATRTALGPRQLDLRRQRESLHKS